MPGQRVAQREQGPVHRASLILSDLVVEAVLVRLIVYDQAGTTSEVQLPQGIDESIHALTGLKHSYEHGLSWEPWQLRLVPLLQKMPELLREVRVSSLRFDDDPSTGRVLKV